MIYLDDALDNLGSVNQPGYNLLPNTNRVCLVPNVDLREEVGYKTLKSNFLLWYSVSWTTKKILPPLCYSGCSAIPCGAKGLNREKKKISKMTFHSLFLLFVYLPSILCTLKKWRAYRWSNFTSLVREMFLKHMQRTVQVVLLVNVKADGNTPKTLLLSLSFFLKFSSVQENPSNWKLVYTLQQ